MFGKVLKALLRNLLKVFQYYLHKHETKFLPPLEILFNPKPFKWQPHKMVNHTQTIRRQQPTNCLSVFNLFCGWRLKSESQLPNKTVLFASLKAL